jgi:predicted RNA-binding protein YlxR (DUF448 family)
MSMSTAASAAATVSTASVTRRIPQRTCIGCRTVRPRAELLRLVLPATRDAGALVIVDRSGRVNGRGAYLCRASARECLEQARRRRALVRALRTTSEHIDHEALVTAVTVPPASGTGADPEELTSPR